MYLAREMLRDRVVHGRLSSFVEPTISAPRLRELTTEFSEACEATFAALLSRVVRYSGIAEGIRRLNRAVAEELHSEEIQLPEDSVSALMSRLMSVDVSRIVLEGMGLSPELTEELLAREIDIFYGAKAIDPQSAVAKALANVLSKKKQ